MRSPLRSPAQVEGPQGVLPQPEKDLERPSSTRLEARFPYYDLRVKTRSPSPFAWRPDFLAAPASNTGDYSAASNTGYRSAASNTGYQSAASNTGDYSAASNTGYRSAASNTGAQSAASNTGDYSAASNAGYQSAASVAGAHSVAISSGIGGKARASAGSAVVLCYRNDDGELLHIRAAIAGQGGVKPDTWYSLGAAGEFVEVSE